MCDRGTVFITSAFVQLVDTTDIAGTEPRLLPYRANHYPGFLGL